MHAEGLQRPKRYWGSAKHLVRHRLCIYLRYLARSFKSSLCETKLIVMITLRPVVVLSAQGIAETQFELGSFLD